MRAVVAVAVGLGFLWGRAAHAETPAQVDEAFRVFVPAGKPEPVYTSQVLEKGRCYTVTASGTFGVWAGINHGVDAYYGYGEWRWGPKPVVTDSLLLDDKSMYAIAVENKDPVAYNLDHSYTTRISGRGKKLKLQINDARAGSWSDNSLGVSVVIRPCKNTVS